MLDERVYEERGWTDTLKNIFGKLLLLAIVLFLIYLPLKTLYLNRPKLSPQKVVISYLQSEQSSHLPADATTLQAGRKLAEEFLFSELEKVEILKEKYKDISRLNWIQKEKAGQEPVFEAKEIKIEEKIAKVKIYEKTNKKEGWIFFDYRLPKEINFEAELTKIGSWKQGYQWKIIKIDSPDLILERNIGEKAEIREGVFIKPIKFEKVDFPAVRKIYSLEIEYENNSNNPTDVYPFGEWRIVNLSRGTFNPSSQTSALFLRTPTLFGGELKPGEIKSGYVMFETEKEISAKEIIFKNMEKKVIFTQ